MKYSWNAKTPMTSPDMVAKPIKWNPMSEDWKKRVEAMQLYNEDATAPWLTNEMKKTLRALRDRILTFGGDEVLLNTRDEDAEKVLERGQFFYGSKYMKKALRIQLINGYCDLSMRIGILDGIADNIQNNFLHLCFITQDLIVDHIQAALIFQRFFCKG